MTKYKFLSKAVIAALCLFSVSVPAQEQTSEPSPATEENHSTPEPEKKTVLDQTNQAVKDAADTVKNALGNTRSLRENADYLALLNYSPLDLIIPSKYGASLGIIRSADSSWELEYLHGSISVPFLIEDLGKMTDDRLSIIKRSYFGNNSFNVSYGLTYFDFSVHLGDELMNRLSGGSYPNIDLVELESLGFNLAIGNRWTFKHNITLGVDWISWAQPVIITKKHDEFLKYADNQNDKDDVEKAVDLVSYFPRLAFLKLQLGILF